MVSAIERLADELTRTGSVGTIPYYAAAGPDVVRELVDRYNVSSACTSCSMRRDFEGTDTDNVEGAL